MSDFSYRHSIYAPAGGISSAASGGYQHMAEARVYVPTAGGGHRTETQTLRLPDRFVRSAFRANNNPQPYGARYGGSSRSSSVRDVAAEPMYV